jgi:hypothetical protein
MGRKRIAKRLRKALRALYGASEPTEHLVIDALTDLRHLCDVDQVDFASCDCIAKGHYLSEMDGAKEDRALGFER